VFATLAGNITASRRHRPDAGDGAALAFERSRLAAVFVAVLLVPALLVIDGPRDWRLGILAAAPTVPPMIALVIVRQFGVDVAIACQFVLGSVMAALSAATGFGFAAPALILSIMMIDSLLLGRTIASSLWMAAVVAMVGLLSVGIGTMVGGFEPSQDLRFILFWLAVPYLAQLGAAIVLWRDHYRAVDRLQIRPQNDLSDAIERAQREAGLYVDRAGRVKEVTVNGMDVIGISPVSLEGRGFIERLHLLDRPALLKAISEAALDGLSGVLRMRLAYCVNNGPVTFRWFEGRLFPISNAPETALIMLRDINNEVSSMQADEARRHQAELERQRRAGFLADLSHDVRTPLNAIIGFAEMMQRSSFGPLGHKRYEEYVGDIHNSGHHLLEMVNDILDLTKAEAGKLDLFDDIVNLAEIADAACRMVAPQARAEGVTVSNRITRSLPKLRGDERRLTQIMLNFVSNAVKFSNDGGRVELDAFIDIDGSFAVTVRDNGIGIAEADIPRVMEIFQQADNSHTRRYGGTGLGLPLSKKLIELHGGTLVLESKLGLGTRIIARFPASRVVTVSKPAAANVIPLVRAS
jgi:two-component system, cell cycle sensor histidine kinase DivJ